MDKTQRARIQAAGRRAAMLRREAAALRAEALGTRGALTFAARLRKMSKVPRTASR